DFPTVPLYRVDLGNCLHGLGTLLEDTPRKPEAETAYREALAVQERLVADFPKVPEYLGDLASTMNGLAELARGRKDLTEATGLLQKAHTHIQAALATNPQHPYHHGVRCDNRRYFAQVLLDQGEYVRAADIAADLVHQKLVSAKDAYSAGCLFSRCYASAEKDDKLEEAKRIALARSYAEQAIENVRLAITKNYKDIEQMKKDPDLDPLRSRDEFKKLLAEMEKKAK